MTNLKLPNGLKVGPYRYTVKVEDTPFLGEDNQVLCGQADHNKGLLRVLKSTPERMYTTFWHEVLHAIDDTAGTDLTEDTVNRLAPLLVAVLCDNKMLKESP